MQLHWGLVQDSSDDDEYRQKKLAEAALIEQEPRFGQHFRQSMVHLGGT